MILVQVVIREDDNETLMCFHTEIKFIVITYLYYEFILCTKTFLILIDVL